MYRPYRGSGRRRRRRTLLFLPVLLLLVFLIAVVLIGKDHIVYTDDGIRFDFDGTGPSASDGTPASSAVSEFRPADTPDVSIESTALPPEHPAYLRVLYLSAPQVRSASLSDALERAKEDGYNAVLFDIKGPDGALTYPSALPKAVKKASDSALADAVAAAKAAGLRTVGRLTCFLDGTAPRSFPAMAVRTGSGVTWLDYDYTSWLSPFSADARAYLTSVAGEAAKLGFDELCLDAVSFPTRGKTSLIRYAATDTDRAGAVSAFVSQVADSVDIPVGVELSADALADPSKSGQDAAALLRAADCLWADADALPLASALVPQDAVAQGLLRPVYAEKPQTMPDGESFAVIP